MKLCPRLLRIESLEVHYNVNRSGLYLFFKAFIFPLHCATVRWYPRFASSAYCKAGMTTEELVKQ